KGVVMKRIRSPRASRPFSLAVALGIFAATVFWGAAPSGGAPSPNLLADGGFEAPITPTGQANPPFGTCGTSVDINGDTFHSGCWEFGPTPTAIGSVTVDRSFAKSGKQSMAFHLTASGGCCISLIQPVVAGPGTYRLQFAATSDSTNELT